MKAIQVRHSLIEQFSDFAGGEDQFRIVEDYVNAVSVSLMFVCPRLRGVWNIIASEKVGGAWGVHVLAFAGIVGLTEIEDVEVEDAVINAGESAATKSQMETLSDEAERQMTDTIFIKRFEALNRFKTSSNGVTFTIQTNPFSLSTYGQRSRPAWLHATFESRTPTLLPALDASVGQMKQTRDVLTKFGWGGQLGEFTFMIEQTVL
jgi:hypothetical protein